MRDYSEFLIHADELQSTILTHPAFVVSSLFQVEFEFELIEVALLCTGFCGTSIACIIRVMRASHNPKDYALT